MARPRKQHEIGASSSVAVRITPRLRADLDALAARNGRPISEEMRVALEAHVARCSGADDGLEAAGSDFGHGKRRAAG